MDLVYVFNLMRILDIMTNLQNIYVEKCLEEITDNEERCREYVEKVYE